MITWIPIEFYYNESSNIEESKADNGKNGSEFERAVTNVLNKEGGSWISPDAERCGNEIIQLLHNDNKQISNAEQCGQHVNSERGDIKVFTTAGEEIRLEMKYVEGGSTGTWHNTSPNLLRVLFNGDFTTVLQQMDRLVDNESCPYGTVFDIDKNCRFICDGSTFFQCLDAVLEPFYLLGLISKPKHITSPFDIKESEIIKNNTKLTLTKNKKGDIYVSHSLNTWSLNDAIPSDKKLSNNDYWDFNGTVTISLSSIYKTVMVKLGRCIASNTMKNHFQNLQNNPENTWKLLSAIIDKVRSADGIPKGKPDYLVVYSRKNGKTTIFNCGDFSNDNGVDVIIQQTSNFAYKIGNSNIGFKCQYSWGNGTFIKNPVIRISKAKI